MVVGDGMLRPTVVDHAVVVMGDGMLRPTVVGHAVVVDKVSCIAGLMMTRAVMDSICSSRCCGFAIHGLC